METADVTTSFLKEIRFGGRRIILGDQSVWEISPRHRENTWFWNLAERIEVFNGNDPAYPFRLINLDHFDMIDAQFVGVYAPA